MAHVPKTLGQFDLSVLHALREVMAASGRPASVRAVVAASGLGLNRAGKILRGETPPMTVGELDALASAYGSSAAAVLAAAEQHLSSV